MALIGQASTHMAPAARFVDDRTYLKGGIRHDCDKPQLWPEVFGHEQATLVDPSHPCQAGGKFVRGDAFQFFEVIGR
jgi:hypothetical protein